MTARAQVRTISSDTRQVEARACATPSGRVAVHLAIVIGLAGCSGDSWHVRGVTAVDGGIAFDIASCNATYDIDVEENADAILITLDRLTPTDPPGAECADEQLVPLSEPLGERDVIVNPEEFEVADAMG